MAKLGFIGLGIMGTPMAGHLLKAGHEVFLNTRSDVPQNLIDLGGVSCINPKIVAQNADIIFTMVPDTPDVEKVLFSKDGLASGLSNGKYVVDMSSISPIKTKEFAKEINSLECEYLDAPVSGGEQGAIDACLSIMVGANEDAFNTIKPYFEILGKTITLIGENGAGQTTKLANNLVVALNIQAVSEALVFASKSGVDPQKVKDALMGGSASSKALDVQGQKIINRDFEPGFRIELHQKDLNNALESAKALNVSLPHTASVFQNFNSCFAKGLEKEDNSALVKILEQMSECEVKNIK